LASQVARITSVNHQHLILLKVLQQRIFWWLVRISKHTDCHAWAPRHLDASFRRGWQNGTLTSQPRQLRSQGGKFSWEGSRTVWWEALWPLGSQLCCISKINLCQLWLYQATVHNQNLRVHLSEKNWGHLNSSLLFSCSEHHKSKAETCKAPNVKDREPRSPWPPSLMDPFCFWSWIAN
jgi:hypothetical protein